MQTRFATNTDVTQILDAGPEGAFIALQVLDASTLFFGGSKETLLNQGLGLAAPNLTQGFQLKSATGIFTTWWTGVMYGRSDTAGGLIEGAVIYKRPKCGCGGGGPQRDLNFSYSIEPGFAEAS